MKWYKKHIDLDSSEVRCFDKLRSKYGYHRAYAFFHLMRDLLAKYYDEQTNTSTVSRTVLKTVLGTRSAIVSEIVSVMVSESVLETVSETVYSIELRSPKMLEILDEWTRKKVKNSGGDMIREDKTRYDKGVSGVSITNKNNSTSSFEKQFNPEVIKLNEAFNKLGLITPKLRKNIPTILEKWENLENFEKWYSGLISSETFKNKPEAERVNFIRACIFNELKEGE